MKNKSLNLTVKEFNTALDELDDFLLTSHVYPEGDSIGSTLATHSLLKRLGKQSAVIAQDPIPKRFQLLGSSEWQKFDDVLIKRFPQACILLDCANVTRIGKVQSLIGPHTKVFNIDHHASNPLFGTYNFVVETAASTGQLVWELFKDRKIELTADEAKWIYATLATDTGWFRYGNVNSSVLELAATLCDGRFPLAEFNEKLLTTWTLSQIQLFSKLFGRVRFEKPDKVAWSYVRLEDFELFGLQKESVEGFIDFLRYLENAEISFFLIETEPGQISVSLRSQGKRTVHDLAAVFGGGGHRQAAGFVFKGSVEQAAQAILTAIRSTYPFEVKV